MARRPKRCFIVSAGEAGLHLWPRDWPIFLKLKIASELQPPSVSTMSGRNYTPAAWHAGRPGANFRLYSTDIKGMTRESGCWAAAPFRVSFWSGQMTDTSSAADLPWLQLGSRTSARRELEFGTRQGASLLGPAAAAWAAAKITSRRELWRAMRLIPSATTSHLMVTMDVSHTATLRTWVGSPMEGHPQPVPKWAAELMVMEVKAEGNWRNDI